MIALTLQRGSPENPGPIIAHLIGSGRLEATSVLMLRAPDRQHLLAGRLFLQLYTRDRPLGAGGAPVLPDRR